MNLVRSWKIYTVVFKKWPAHGYSHSTQRAFPRVAESKYFLIRVSFLPKGEDARQGGWRVRECRVLKPSPTVCKGPSSLDGRGVSSLVLDSATPPYDFAQNDKGGFSIVRDYCLLKVKYNWWPWLKSDDEDMNTSTVRYIWRWVLMKSKKTLCL